MRLICPNCGAQYEVDPSVIPPSGRDVQCSGCGKTWFEEPGGLAHGDDSGADDESTPHAQGMPPAPDGTIGDDGADAGLDADNRPDIPRRSFSGQPDDAYDEDYQDTRPPQTGLHTAMPWGKGADDGPQPNTTATDAATGSTAATDAATGSAAAPDAAAGSIAATAAATASSLATLIPPHAAMTSRATGTASQTPPAPLMTAQDAVPPRRTITPAIADILRAEAAREEAARRAEAGGIESQPELGLDAAPARPPARPPAVERPDAHSGTSVDAPATTEPDAPKPEETKPEETQRRLAMLRGEPVPTAGAPQTDNAGTRRALLPDIAEINSTLRPADEREDMADAADPAQAEVVQRRGFRIGFGSVIILAVAFAALYSYAPRVGDAVPGAQPALTQYVATVDDARIWLDEQIRSMLDRMNAQGG